MSVKQLEMALIDHAMISSRNAAWVPVLEGAAQKGPVLAAFGALHLPGEHGELVDRGGPHEVAGHEHGRAALGFQQPSQLCRRSGFSRTIQAHDQNATGLFEIERGGVAAEQRSLLATRAGL